MFINKVYSAHIRITESGVQKQTLKEHCINTSQYAKSALECVNLGASAELSGLLHDMGKMTEEYGTYLERAVFEKDSSSRSSVNHTFCGVRYLLKKFHTFEDDFFSGLASELIAYAIGSHHGLFDCIDENKKSGFIHRLEKNNIKEEEAVKNFFLEHEENYVERLFDLSKKEAEDVCQKLELLIEKDQIEGEGKEGYFYLGLLARLLSSSVIEGDRRDTAEFMNNMQYPKFPTGEERKMMWEKHLNKAEDKLQKFKQEKEIHRARQKISDQCAMFAENPSGIYRLDVPTGSGKTLSSLRYALSHAKKYNKARIVFVSPLLSILEQNAAEIRKYIEDDGIILEHHSNVIRSNYKEEELDLNELLEENWSAPIVITTLVQFLNTIFEGKTSCIRRFQALCNSIIVIDEVQTVPTKLLTLFNLSVNFLYRICNATVILCSATQPCLDKTKHPIFDGFEQVEMIPYQKELWTPFLRTELKDMGKMRLEDISVFAWDVLDEANSLLIVCNKKEEAERLYQAMQAGDAACFHLSAAMCMEHRRKALKNIEKSLERKDRKTICISTQVIEAGVNISFERVIRLTAGMDNIVQAAGRCNRNGESDRPCPVYIVQCEGEKLSELPEIRDAKAATDELLAEYRKKSTFFQNRLDSKEAISYYYNRLYSSMAEGHQDDCIRTPKTSLFSLLSDNDAFVDEEDGYCLHQAFKLAGKNFSVFGEDTTDVIVPYQKGKEIILDLGSLDVKKNPAELKKCLEDAKPYTVSIYHWQKKKLGRALIPKCDGSVLVLQEGYYDEMTGLKVGEYELEFLGV